MFQAILIRKDDQGYRAALESLDDAALPVIDTGGVTVRVSHSTLNYKDGLAITGRSPVVRQFPLECMSHKVGFGRIKLAALLPFGRSPFLGTKSASLLRRSGTRQP